MKYYIYKIDLDVMDKIKEFNADDEQAMLMLKTNGQCILEYTKEEYIRILNEIGKENADILRKKFLSLADIRNIYDNVKLSEGNGYIREFKLKIYPTITECMGIIVLEQEEAQVKKQKKWYEFWKK